MTQTRVLVIILNWKQPETTIECVRTVQAMQPAPEILVIDNGSGDGSAEKMQAELTGLTILALPKNLGFAGGCNVGLKQAIEQGFNYALLLNNDAFPAPDMLDCLLREAAEDIGLSSPKILYESAPDLIWFAGGTQHRWLLELRNSGQNEKDDPVRHISRDTDYLWGTCLLVNLAAAQQIGLLDDRFFMYYEDLDWSIRFRQAGYRLRLVADARLYHRVAVSTGGMDSPLHRYYLGRSSVLFFRRHAHLGFLPAIFLYRLGSAVKMVLRLLLTGRQESATTYLQGLWEGWQLAGVETES